MRTLNWYTHFTHTYIRKRYYLIGQSVYMANRGGSPRRGVVRLRGEGWFVCAARGGSSAWRGVVRVGGEGSEIFAPATWVALVRWRLFAAWSALCWAGPVLDE